MTPRPPERPFPKLRDGHAQRHVWNWLTNSKVCVDGGIARRPCEVLVLSVGDVLVCAGIPVLLGQPKVNDVDQVSFLPQPHEEVIWLHISVDEVLRVNVLNTTNLEAERQRQETESQNTMP